MLKVEERRNEAPPKGFKFGALPPRAQDAAIVEDILWVLIGIEGEYIRRSENGLRADAGVIGSMLSGVVDRLCPLALAYVKLTQCVIEGTSVWCRHGSVRQALYQALERVLTEYRNAICQLQHKRQSSGLSVQQLLFYVHPLLPPMLSMSNLVQRIEELELQGGALLSHLYQHHQHVSPADVQSKSLAKHLLESACGPYFAILNSWVNHGVLEDAHGEFLVSESEQAGSVQSSGVYWSQKFRLRPKEDIPVFVARHAESILATGKYASLLSHFHSNDQSQFEPLFSDTVLSFDVDNQQAWASCIARAYRRANQELLRELKSGKPNLLSLLRSLGMFFFLRQADFALRFVETCEDELSKSVLDASATRMQSLLDHCIASSTAKRQDFSNDIEVVLLASSVEDEIHSVVTPSGAWSRELNNSSAHMPSPSLLARDAFGITTRVAWPLSLIVTQSLMQGYSLAFRRSFQLLLLSSDCSAAWHSLSRMQKTANLTHGSQWHFGLHGACALVARMSQFVRVLRTHISQQVLIPEYEALMQNVHAAGTVEQVLVQHEQCLERCMAGMFILVPHTESGTLCAMLDVIAAFCSFVLKIEREVNSTALYRQRDTASMKIATSRHRSKTQKEQTSQLEKEMTAWNKAMEDLLKRKHFDEKLKLMSNAMHDGMRSFINLIQHRATDPKLLMLIAALKSIEK